MRRKVCIVLILLSCGALNAVQSQTTGISETTEITKATKTTDTTGIPETTTKFPFFMCTRYAGTEFDLKGLSGLWFETARGTNVDKMECLNYTLADSPNDNNMLELQVEYVDAANSKWESVKESKSLIWDENAKNGIFTWKIGEDSTVNATYKLVETDLTSYAIFCGYEGLAYTPLTKVWTRNRHLTDEQRKFIQNKFKEMIQLQYLNWVTQSEEKCNNSAMTLVGGHLLALTLALVAGFRNI